MKKNCSEAKLRAAGEKKVEIVFFVLADSAVLISGNEQGTAPLGYGAGDFGGDIGAGLPVLF